jgi:hypothetical protein
MKLISTHTYLLTGSKICITRDSKLLASMPNMVRISKFKRALVWYVVSMGRREKQITFYGHVLGL